MQTSLAQPLKYVHIAHPILCTKLFVSQELERVVLLVGCIGSNDTSHLLDEIRKRQLVIQIGIECSKKGRALGDTLGATLLILGRRQHSGGKRQRRILDAEIEQDREGNGERHW
jgi:hypothetical protein